MALEQSKGGMDPEALAAMMQQMGVGQKKKEKQRWGHFRFLPNDQRPSGLQTYTGWDPLESVLYKNRRKEYSSKLDRAAWDQSLHSYAVHSPNFHPFHEIMQHKNWTDDDKLYAVSSLLNLGVSPDLLLDGQQIPALHRAIELRNTKIARKFIEYGANLSGVDDKGNTPLMNAVISGQNDLIVPMLRKNATVRKNLEGQDVTYLAVERYKKTGDDYSLFTALHAIKKFKLGLDDMEPWPSDDIKKMLFERDRKASEHNETLRLNRLKQRMSELEADNSKPLLIQRPTPRAHTNPGRDLYIDSSIDNMPSQLPKGVFFGTIDALAGGYFSKAALRNGREFIAAKNAFEQNMTELSVMGLLRKKPDAHKPEDYQRFIDKLTKLNKDDHFPDLKLGPLEENLSHFAIRHNDPALLKYAISVGSNLNALDKNGQSPMHLLVSRYTNVASADINARNELIAQLGQLVGMSGDKNERTPMNKEGFYADWSVLNSEGRTFLEELKILHPEWAKHTAHVLGIPEDHYEQPKQILALTYEKPPSLNPSDIPDLNVLNSVSTTTDKMGKSIQLQEWLHKIYNRLNDPDITHIEKQGFLDKVESLMTQSEDDVKVHALFEMSTQIENQKNPVNINAVNALLGHIGSKLENGTHDQREQLFQQFDDVMRSADENGTDLRMLQGLWVQMGTLTNNGEMLKMGTRMENALSRMAEQKYGTFDEQANSAQPKSPDS